MCVGGREGGREGERECVRYNSEFIPPDAIAPRGSVKNPTAASVLDGDPGKLEQVMSKEERRATLRLKKDGQAVVEEVVRIDILSALPSGHAHYFDC